MPPIKKLRFKKKTFSFILCITILLLFYTTQINTNSITKAKANITQPRYISFIIFGDMSTVYKIWQNYGNVRYDKFLYEVEEANPGIDFGKMQEGTQVKVPRELVQQ